MTELLRRGGALLADAPDGIEKLRRLVRHLAVAGKLTAERGPGSDDEWRHAKFGDVFSLEYGENLPAPKRSGTGEFPVYGSNGVVGSHVDACVRSPCLVVGRKGSAGAVNVCEHDGCWVTDVAYYTVPPDGVTLQYAYLLFLTLGLDELGKGIKPGLSRSEAYVLPISIPPLAEQHRIVAKVDELMALCDRLEARQQDAEAAHARLVQALLDSLTQARDAEEFQACWQRVAGQFEFLLTREESVDALKQVVLSLAISGQLTDVVSDDGESGSELAKHRIGSKGHARKGWATAALGELGSVLGGATPSKARPDFWAGPIPWVSPKDMKRPEIADAEDHVSAAALDSTALKLVPANSILMVVRGMILAHSFPVARTLAPVTINQDMKALVPPADLVPYLLLALQALKPQIVATVDRSSHGTCKLVSEKLWSTEIGIPPLAEQRRIVAKVTELLALCDQLKARIAAARAKHGQLAEALVEAAVA